MKKLYFYFFSILSCIIVTFFIHPVVQADATLIITMTDGASIRLDDPASLRFSAQVKGDFSDKEIHYGFLIAEGSYTVSEMKNLYSSGKIQETKAGALDSNNVFYGAVTHILASDYDTFYAALAYVEVDGVKTYATSVCTRSVEEVASSNLESKGKDTTDYVRKIVNSTEFNLNGGLLETDYSFTIGSYNKKVDEESGIVLVSKDNVGFISKYTYKISLITTGYDHIYKIGEVKKSGESLNQLLNWDYVLLASSIEDVSLLKNIGENNQNYIYITDYRSEAKVYCDTQINKFTNRLYLEPGDKLPTCTKDYYDFVGWYDNKELNGKAVDVYTSNGATYYAKFTPTNYKITYELQGGSCSTEGINSYNVESEDILLPQSHTISISNGSFLGWYDNPYGVGETLTVIPSGSHGERTVYALYQMDFPTEVTLTPNASSVITLSSPTKFVSSEFTYGNFSINGKTYSVSEGTLYHSLDDAIASIKANDEVIYLFPGDYTLSEPCQYSVTVTCENEIVKATASRTNEATITLKTNVQTLPSSITFNGLKLISDSLYQSTFTSTTNTNSVTFNNVYFYNHYTLIDAKTGSGSYYFDGCYFDTMKQFVIWTSSNTKLVSIKNSHFDLKNCGSIGSDSLKTALFRIRSGDFTFINNDLENNLKLGLYFLEIKEGTATLNYNTFKYSSPKVYVSESSTGYGTLKVDKNLYLDSLYNYLSSSTLSIYYDKSSLATHVTLDTTLYKNESELQTAYYSYLTEHLTYGDRLNQTKLAIDTLMNGLTEVKSSITLPTLNELYATTIYWTSSCEEVMSSSGVYGKVYVDTLVTLKAKIKYNNETIVATYELLIKASYKSLNITIASGYARKINNLITEDFETYDILTCAFVKLKSDGTVTGNTSSFLANCNAMIPLAHEKGCYVLFSIEPSSSWSTACDPANNLYDTIASNIVNIINTYGFDGVDIDWETPSKGEYTWFTSLMKAIYTKVKENNAHHLVTAAIGGGKWMPPCYDLTNSQNYLDYINVMTYGMSTSSGNYQSALYKSSNYNDTVNQCGKTLVSCSIDESVKIYHDTYGVPKSKLIMGVPFYGVKQIRTYDASTSTYSSWTRKGSITYLTVSSYISSGDYDIYYDNVSKVPYLLSKDKLSFVSYENQLSMTEKANYVKSNGLAGLFTWDNQNDLNRECIVYFKNALNK